MKTPRSVSAFQLISTGLISELTAVTLTAPFDVVRITAQLGTIRAQSTVWETAKELYGTEGVFAFFKGNNTHCWRILISLVANFYITNVTKASIMKLISGQVANNVLLASFLGSAVGAFASSVIVYPLDVIRIRLIQQSRTNVQYDGLLDCLVKTYKREGIRALFLGVEGVALIVTAKEIVRHACYLTTALLPKSWTSSISYKWKNHVFSAIAQIVTYPLDTIMKKSQGYVDPSYNLLINRTDVSSRSFFETARLLTEPNRRADLWKGISALVAKTVPSLLLKVGLSKVIQVVYATLLGDSDRGYHLQHYLTPNQLYDIVEQRKKTV